MLSLASKKNLLEKGVQHTFKAQESTLTTLIGVFLILNQFYELLILISLQIIRQYTSKLLIILGPFVQMKVPVISHYFFRFYRLCELGFLPNLISQLVKPEYDGNYNEQRYPSAFSRRLIYFSSMSADCPISCVTMTIS